MTNEDGPARLLFLFSCFIVAVPVLALTLLIGPRALAEESARHFSLRAQRLTTALTEFGRQSGMQVLYGADSADSSENLDAVVTTTVVGDFTVEDALTLMLKGTGRRFRFTAATKIVVERDPTYGTSESQQLGQSEFTATFQPASYSMPVEEIHVTGTRIRGVLDVVSPTVQLPSRELRRSTFSTVQDAFYTLPVTSLSGPREDYNVSGNISSGAGINLRHLGPGATLILVNGYRQPASGLEALFTDVSTIPWSVIDRIEIVPDGSSAIYGSDAIAGVVNIIMREKLDGAESQARVTSVPGGADETQLSQLFGKHWSSGHALIAYQYSERAPLAAADRAYAANGDKSEFGGSDHRTFYAAPGNILDPMSLQPVLGIPTEGVAAAGGYSSRINLANRFEQLDLLPERQTHNAFLTATQALGDIWSVHAEGRYAQRRMMKREVPFQQLLVVPRTNPFFVEPFPDHPSSNVLVAHSFTRDFGGPLTSSATTRVTTGAASAKGSMPNGWELAVSQAVGREELQWLQINVPDFAALRAALNATDPAKAFNPFGYTDPGVLNRVRSSLQGSAVSRLATTSMVADGTVGRLPAGAVKLAVGAEYRRESFNYARLYAGTTTTNKRNVTSAFAETSIPVIGSPHDARAAPRLEIMAAGRFEDYSDFGSTFIPRFGVKWAPLDEFKLRGSWGRSFRAPTLVDRDTTTNGSGIVSLVDPKSPSGRSMIAGLQGNNPDVHEERATTWTAGFDLIPPSVPGLTLSLTYFAVDYGDRIVRPAQDAPFEILLHEDQWQSLINRNPTQAQIDAVCQRKDFFGPPTCSQAQPTIIVDIRKTNLSDTKVKGLDIDMARHWENRIGSMNLQLTGTYMLEFKQRSSPTAPLVSVLNTSHNPPALRLRALGEWSQHSDASTGLSAAAAINFTSKYRDTERAPPQSVAAWTTLDLQFSYRTMAESGWRANTEVMLNAVNVLDSSPPFIDREFGYDIVNAQPIGRTISIEVRKSW